jgi:hypothetical protein
MGGRRGLKATTLKRMLKKAGLKVSGKKSTLRARAKKAHLVRGGMTSAAYPFAAGMAQAGGASSFGTAGGPGLVGGRRHGVKAKTLKKLLKRAGLKVSGKKATLRARAKKAHLVRGGAVGLGVVGSAEQAEPVTGGRRRSRSLFRKFF